MNLQHFLPRFSMVAFSAMVSTAPLHVGAESANYQIVHEKKVPAGWTQPAIVHGQHGATIVPSVPSDFQPLRTGTDPGLSSATVHSHGRKTVKKEYRLRLSGGKAIVIQPGDIIPVKQWRLKFLGEKNGAYWFEDVKTGRRLRMVRRKTPPRRK